MRLLLLGGRIRLLLSVAHGPGADRWNVAGLLPGRRRLHPALRGRNIWTIILGKRATCFSTR
jgi:hypothetical protein